MKNGCSWEDLPKDLPPYSTVFWHYKQWRVLWSVRFYHDGTSCPSAATRPKKPKWTRLIIIDSQAVKNTCNASIKSKGFCYYKCTNGIKRHLAIDTLGLPFFTHCTKANVTDDQGLIEMLSHHLDYFRQKPVNIPKMTILHRRRVSSRNDHDRIDSDLSANHDQDSLSTSSEADEG